MNRFTFLILLALSLVPFHCWAAEPLPPGLTAEKPATRQIAPANAADHALPVSHEALRTRFLKEAPQQWLEYRRIVSRHTEVVETGDSSSSLNNEKPCPAYKLSGSLYLDRQCARAFLAEGKDCLALNPKYYFQIEKGSDNKWKLAEVLQTPSKSRLTPMTDTSLSLSPQPGVCRIVFPEIPNDLIGPSRNAPYSLANHPSEFGYPIRSACLGQQIWSDWLPYLVSSPGFKLLRAEYQGIDDQFVKVEFGFEPIVKDPRIEPITKGGGVVVFDAKRYWLIRDAEIHGRYYDQGRKTLRITNEFKQFEDGSLRIPYVSHQLMTMLLPEGNRGKPLYQEMDD